MFDGEMPSSITIVLGRSDGSCFSLVIPPWTSDYRWCLLRVWRSCEELGDLTLAEAEDVEMCVPQWNMPLVM